MQIFNCRNANCATCINWEGSRQIKNGTVVTESATVKAYCEAVGQDRPANHCKCNDYSPVC